jgi:hypothetical protein
LQQLMRQKEAVQRFQQMWNQGVLSKTTFTSSTIDRNKLCIG